MKQLKPQYACSLELAMDLVGGKWKLFLLWHLSCGTKRFCELKCIMGDIAENAVPSAPQELEHIGAYFYGRCIRSFRRMWTTP